MARPNPDTKLEGIERYRQQVISHPRAQGISLAEVSRYLEKLPRQRFPRFAYSTRGSAPCIQPRGGFPLFAAQYALTRRLDKAGADFIPLTIDSYTRQNQYDIATQLLQRSEEEEKNYLNGYPLVSHGYELTRELYQGINKPVSLRHGTPDARLLVEIALASGITEIEGGGICYCVPYSDGFPIDRSLLYWQYVDRICAVSSTPTAPIHRESFGALTATLVPPAIAVAIQILEALLAAEQGVTSFAVSFGQTGSIIQDIATAQVLKQLTRHYLDEFGFESVQSYLVYHQWMGQFPPERKKAAALIAGSSMISSMISADKVVVKTVDEAIGVPDAEVNAEAVEMVRYVLRIFACAEPVTSPLIDREATLIESETRSILNAIFDISGDVFWESIFRAFQLGYLDIPFSPHADNVNQLIPMRDANGSIRIFQRGKVPISDQDADREKRLLALNATHADKTYRQLLKAINIMV
ncbi:MAG: methylaspartate mutase subunit E [Candidatus Competibacteraceae bacterium]